jgi:ABC-type transporter Mla maintaining outer membrane lipid asymmetry ATPase subunit MlaF
MLLKADNIMKQFNDTVVLTDISLQVMRVKSLQSSVPPVRVNPPCFAV